MLDSELNLERRPDLPDDACVSVILPSTAFAGLLRVYVLPAAGAAGRGAEPLATLAVLCTRDKRVAGELNPVQVSAKGLDPNLPS